MPHSRRARAGRFLVRVALVPIVAVLALWGATTPPDAAAQRAAATGAVAGYTYTFRIETDDETMTGTTLVAGDRSRIELRDGDGERRGDYLLVADGGRTLMVVHPQEREYSVTDAEHFERIVGKVMEGMDKVMTLDLENLEMTGARLGAGGTVAGHATQRSRLVADFSLRMGALGFNTTMQHHAELEYWVAPDLALPRNPLLELFAGLPLVLAQHDRDFTTRLAAGRRELVGRGTPLKVVVTSQSTDEEGEHERHRAVVEITGVARADHDPAAFRVPAGYRKTEGFTFGPHR